MSERAKQFLSQLEQTDRKFVHIECDILREAIAEAKAQATDECMQALESVLDDNPQIVHRVAGALIDAVRSRLT
jgi:hypothetical protein